MCSFAFGCLRLLLIAQYCTGDGGMGVRLLSKGRAVMVEDGLASSVCCRGTRYRDALKLEFSKCPRRFFTGRFKVCLFGGGGLRVRLETGRPKSLGGLADQVGHAHVRGL